MPLLPPLDRARGCLLGLAIGDALGAPLEGLSAQQIRAHYGVVDGYVDGARAWKKKPYRWRMPGLYSDDTQQALALCDVLIECGQIDAQRLAEIYLELATPRGSYMGAHRGVGRSFRQVLTDLEQNISPSETGQRSAGIGAAMRIAPVGLCFDPAQGDKLFDSVMAASLMTHRDIRSLAGAMTVALAIQGISRGAARIASYPLRLAAEVARFERRIIEKFGKVAVSISDHPSSMSRSIAQVESLLEMPRDRAITALIEEANRHGASPACRRPTMGFPPACIPTCLYLYLTTDSFEEALVEVINLGGDADSAGAILGAMVGAHFGVEAIPERWLNGLQNREGIELRADALLRGSTEGLAIPNLVEREKELSALEGVCRARLLTHSQNGGDLGANRRI